MSPLARDEIPNGISLRRARKLAESMGMRVEHSGEGDLVFFGPDRTVKHHATRKVASRALVVLLRREQRRLA